jgi:hypothetical protein
VKFRCRGGHSWTSQGFKPTTGEQFCPECGAHALANLKQSSGGGLKADVETDAHREARLEFDRLVCEWPCWARDHRPGHRCRGPKDAHHLIAKSWIESHFSDLPELDYLEIKYAVIIGASACRFEFHDALESHVDYVYWHELDDELKVFCKRMDERWGDVPQPSGAKRPSLFERLRIESPPKTKGAALAASGRSST